MLAYQNGNEKKTCFSMLIHRGKNVSGVIYAWIKTHEATNAYDNLFF